MLSIGLCAAKISRERHGDHAPDVENKRWESKENNPLLLAEAPRESNLGKTQMATTKKLRQFEVSFGTTGVKKNG